MPPDGDGDEDEGIRCVYSTSINSGLWGNALPYQILLDIQQSTVGIFNDMKDLFDKCGIDYAFIFVYLKEKMKIRKTYG